MSEPSERSIRKIYPYEFTKKLIQKCNAKTESMKQLSNDLLNKQMKIKDLEGKLSTAESKLKQNAAEKTAETKKVNNKLQLELNQANFKVQHLESRVAELEVELKDAMKRGLKKPSPWWYLHSDPVPEYVELILEAQCKFCHRTFKTSKGKKLGSTRLSVAQGFYRIHYCNAQPRGIPLEYDCPKKWGTLKSVQDVLNRSTVIVVSSPFTLVSPDQQMIVSSSDDED